MIVKMIKNLENKMEKMQESITKDLEEWKNKHTEINSTITEIKDTLEWNNSRISEAEGQISKLEDKMVEITSEEQNKLKRMKKILRIVSDTSGQYQMHQHLNYRVPEEGKKKGYEKIFEEIIIENSPNMEKEIVKSKRCKESHTG